MRNRKIQSTGKQDEVLLDENMVEFIYESPLFVREHSKKLLRSSVWNDTLFLARQNVMDYSLMIAVDESRKELVVGIVGMIACLSDPYLLGLTVELQTVSEHIRGTRNLSLGSKIEGSLEGAKINRR